MDYPLEDLKILDFTYLLPGPFGTMMLADMGADIIKIENPKNPDLMRFVPPFIDDISAAYMHVNRGKRSLGADLSTEEGRDDHISTPRYSTPSRMLSAMDLQPSAPNHSIALPTVFSPLLLPESSRFLPKTPFFPFLWPFALAIFKQARK